MDKVEICETDVKKTEKIKPYRLPKLMKIASQVTDRLCNMPQCLVSYDEIDFVLETVASAVRRARKGCINGEDTLEKTE